MEKCENTRNVVVFGTNDEKRTALLFNPRCKSWNCDYCAEINKDYWIHQATRGSILITSEGRDIQFVTLTSRNYTTPNQSVYFFKQNWPKLRKRMAGWTAGWESRGIEWAYFLVPERHKSGVLHAHLFAATHITSERIWQKEAWKSGFGYIIDVQEALDPKRTASYVAKYLHKGVGAEIWPRNFRRVRHSQNWPMAKEKALEGWDWVTYRKNETVWLEKKSLENQGWRVIDKTE